MPITLTPSATWKHCKQVLNFSSWWGCDHLPFIPILFNCPHTEDVSSYYRTNLSNLTSQLWTDVIIWQKAYVISSAHLSSMHLHAMISHPADRKPSRRPCLMVRETKYRHNGSICLSLSVSYASEKQKLALIVSFLTIKMMWLAELRSSFPKWNSESVNGPCEYITKPCQDSTKK